MLKKSVVSVLAMVAAITSFSTLATSSGTQQMRDRFEQKLVQPCVGKKEGDKVIITDRHGGQHEAICTLTAIPLPE